MFKELGASIFRVAEVSCTGKMKGSIGKEGFVSKPIGTSVFKIFLHPSNVSALKMEAAGSSKMLVPTSYTTRSDIS
jgi:hypothetical protein